MGTCSSGSNQKVFLIFTKLFLSAWPTEEYHLKEAQNKVIKSQGEGNVENVIKATDVFKYAITLNVVDDINQGEKKFSGRRGAHKYDVKLFVIIKRNYCTFVRFEQSRTTPLNSSSTKGVLAIPLTENDRERMVNHWDGMKSILR